LRGGKILYARTVTLETVTFLKEVQKMLAAIDWEKLITEPVQEMLKKIAGYIPNLLGALVILIVGWIVAKIIRRLVDALLKVARFDTLADKAGITNVLKKGDLKITAREVLSGLVYWLIMIMVLVLVVNALGLPGSSDILEQLFLYIPKVIAALLVLVVAMFLASFVTGIVRTAAANANLPKPNIIAAVCYWAIIIFAVTIALVQLDVAPFLVGTAFNIILAGVCLTLALAFGLGGRDTVARYLEELRKKRDQK